MTPTCFFAALAAFILKHRQLISSRTSFYRFRKNHITIYKRYFHIPSQINFFYQSGSTLNLTVTSEDEAEKRLLPFGSPSRKGNDRVENLVMMNSENKKWHHLVDYFRTEFEVGEYRFVGDYRFIE